MVTLDFYILGIIMIIETFDKHYYDEDTIQVGQPVNCHVVVNHVVELTVEEQQEAKQTAIQQLQQEAYTAMKKKPARVKKESTNQLSLF